MLRNIHYVKGPGSGPVWRLAPPACARDKPQEAATAKDGPAGAEWVGRTLGGLRRCLFNPAGLAFLPQPLAADR
jgi:hypothetical protein